MADFLERVPGMGKHLGVLVEQGYHKMNSLATLDKTQLVKLVKLAAALSFRTFVLAPDRSLYICQGLPQNDATALAAAIEGLGVCAGLVLQTNIYI